MEWEQCGVNMSSWAYGLAEIDGRMYIVENYMNDKNKWMGCVPISKKEFVKNQKMVMKDIRSQLKNWKIPVVKGDSK